MKYLFLTLLLLPLGLFAQVQFHISGDLGVTFLPTTEEGRNAAKNNSSVDQRSIGLGAELWFPNRKKEYNRGVFARYGRIFLTRLQADYRGLAAGSTSESRRTIFAQTKLLRCDYYQFGLMANLTSFDSRRYHWSFQLGGGVTLIHSERIHVAASEFHQGEEQLQTPGAAYVIDAEGIRIIESGPDGVTMLDNMLVKFTHFLETGFYAETANSVSLFFSAQLGLRPIVDAGLYQDDDLKGRLWIQIRTGVKGRLF